MAWESLVSPPITWDCGNVLGTLGILSSHLGLGPLGMVSIVWDWGNGLGSSPII